MKALVTGARGFIGSFLVEALLEQGHEVKCLLRRRPNAGTWLEGLPIEILPGDLSDEAVMPGAIEDCDYVFHLAGTTKAARIEEFYDVNVAGTRRLLDAIVNSRKEIRRFIYVSSLAAAGPGPKDRPLLESDPPAPVSNYGKSKLAAEKLLADYQERVPVSIVRPPSVYGPRERDLFNYFRYAKQGWRPVLTGGPRYLSLIYVRDLVQGLLLVARHDAACGRTYYLSNPTVYTDEAFGKAIGKALDKSPPKVPFPVALLFFAAVACEVAIRITGKPNLFNFDKFAEIKKTNWSCSPAKAQKELGFEVKHSLDEGLRETAEWYLKEGWL